jgi:hypothetical protein
MSSVDIDYRSPFRMVVDNQTEDGVVDPNKFVHDKNYYIKELWGCRDSRVESALDVASAAIESTQQGFKWISVSESTTLWTQTTWFFAWAT